MRAIMYHYIRHFNKKYPYFRFLDFTHFQKQLDYFEKEYGFVKIDEWHNFVQNGVVPKKKGKIILSFDDAIIDHYQFIYPELIKRKLWGIFYVSTSPYENREILAVHKIQLLCGKYSGEELFKYLKSIITIDMINKIKREEFRTQTYTRQNNYEGVTDFKRLLNYFIKYEYIKYCIQELENKFPIEEDINNFYITEKNISEMSKNNMLIGSHSKNHKLMSRLSIKEQNSEIEDSFTFLESICDLGLKTFCHPYGGFHSFNHNTINILNNKNIDFSFNVESRQIVKKDFFNSIQHLPRYDCNQFLHGKAS